MEDNFFFKNLKAESNNTIFQRDQVNLLQDKLNNSNK
jgi:hypothetical protein